MGLWGKLKGAVNAMTGGSATVKLEIGEATLGEDIGFRVIAEANADVSISSVYLLVRAIEEAEVRDVDYDFNDGHRRIERVHGSYETFKGRFEVADGQELTEGETYEWEGTFTVPDSENPSFDGTMISHTWQIQAALDATGNDPDSGWLNFEMWDN
jgi:hypothetical protein